MTANLQKKILSITKQLKDVPNGRNKHFSFIVHRNRILSIGWNDYWQSHPKCKKLGYRFNAMHSELSAILRYRGSTKRFKKFILINTRVNSFGEIGMSKPCECCQNLINNNRFRKVWYTDENGVFQVFS